MCARKQLFTQKRTAIEGLPPTQATLTQHIKRAAYQAGYCWAQMVIKVPELPHQMNVGWKTDEAYWTEAAQACRELIKCRRAAEVAANAKKLLYHAHHSAFVVAIALTRFLFYLKNDFIPY